MYEENNLQDKPVAKNNFYYDGSYYCIGGVRKTVHEDKTADEDFFLLMLVTVAKEIKTRGLPRTLRVVLGVGVLFK